MQILIESIGIAGAFLLGLIQLRIAGVFKVYRL